MPSRLLAAFAIIPILLLTLIVPPNFGQSSSSSYTTMPLQISEIRIYQYNEDNVDHHFSKSPVSMIYAGLEISVNGLVNNQNHTGEHFDYITQITDEDGYVRFLHVREGVAVPLGGQIGIDSERLPVILGKAGSYDIKILTWTNVNGIPSPLSEGAALKVNVVSTTAPDYSRLPEMSMFVHVPANKSGMTFEREGKIGSYCWAEICADTAFIIPDQLIEVQQGSPIRFQVTNNAQPDEVGVLVYEGENRLAEQQLRSLGSRQYLVDLPRGGEYILFVGASWLDGQYSAGSAVYYYKIKVT